MPVLRTSQWSRSPLVQRDLRRFETACLTNDVHRTIIEQVGRSHETLDRVIVVDASLATRGVNGVGNLYGDYMLWFALAAASRRALFIDWTRGVESGHHARRFDLGLYFSGAGKADWTWRAHTRQRVQQRMRRDEPDEIVAWDEKYTCGRLWRLLSSPTPWALARQPQQLV